MTKRTFITGLVIAAVIAGGGVLLASNMGFKLNYALDNSTTAGGGVGDTWMSLPYNPQVGLATAKNLIDDIGSAQTAYVQRYIESGNNFETYTGRAGTPDPDWTLATEGYVVRMNTSVNYIVVGSHDPTASNAMENSTTQGAAGVGDNFLSYPYHSTSATSKNLIDDIGSAQVAFVQRYIKAGNNRETYTGRAGTPDPDWTNAPGEGYIVRMNTTVNYVPSHY